MSTPFTPLFSGGTGRSGTTAIVNLLNNHSQVHTSLPREIRYLTDRFGLLDLNFGRPLKLESTSTELRNRVLGKFLFIKGKSKARIFNERMNGRWWQEVGKKGNPRGLCQAIELDFLNEQLTNFKKEKRTNLYHASIQLYLNLSSAQIKKPDIKYFADSTPANIQNSNRIIKLLPDAHFINMIRDGRDVAYSVTKERWGPDDPHLALKWWQKRIELAHLGLERVAVDKKINLRLEDLILYNRTQSYNLILKFLDLEDQEQLRLEFDNTFAKEKMSMGLWKGEVKSPAKFEQTYLKVLKQLADKGIEIKQYY
jgi:hypothetical protein